MLHKTAFVSILLFGTAVLPIVAIQTQATSSAQSQATLAGRSCEEYTGEEKQLRAACPKFTCDLKYFRSQNGVETLRCVEKKQSPTWNSIKSWPTRNGWFTPLKTAKMNMKAWVHRKRGPNNVVQKPDSSWMSKLNLRNWNVGMSPFGGRKSKQHTSSNVHDVPEDIEIDLLGRHHTTFESFREHWDSQVLITHRSGRAKRFQFRLPQSNTMWDSDADFGSVIRTGQMMVAAALKKRYADEPNNNLITPHFQEGRALFSVQSIINKLPTGSKGQIARGLHKDPSAVAHALASTESANNVGLTIKAGSMESMWSQLKRENKGNILQKAALLLLTDVKIEDILDLRLLKSHIKLDEFNGFLGFEGNDAVFVAGKAAQREYQSHTQENFLFMDPREVRSASDSSIVESYQNVGWHLLTPTSQLKKNKLVVAYYLAKNYDLSNGFFFRNPAQLKTSTQSNSQFFANENLKGRAAGRSSFKATNRPSDPDFDPNDWKVRALVNSFSGGAGHGFDSSDRVNSMENSYNPLPTPPSPGAEDMEDEEETFNIRAPLPDNERYQNLFGVPNTQWRNRQVVF